MTSLLSRRLATIAPAVLKSSFRAAATSHFTTSASSSSSANPRRFSLPFGIFAAACGGTAYFYSYGSTGQVLLDQQPDEIARDVALNPEKWIKFELQEKVSVNHNTYLFRFHFDPHVKLGLHVASCILTRYTPISDPDAKGYFDLLIKVYPEGKMSKHLASLEPGDLVEVKGPIEKFWYSRNMKRHIGMIAGGTGITPMLQIIEAILEDPADNTQVSLIYANISPDDILLKRKLDVLSASHPNFKVFYTVDNPSNNWRGGTGYISKEMILKGLPCPSDDTFILEKKLQCSHSSWRSFSLTLHCTCPSINALGFPCSFQDFLRSLGTQRRWCINSDRHLHSSWLPIMHRQDTRARDFFSPCCLEAAIRCFFLQSYAG